jgi:hypothetical protein
MKAPLVTLVKFIPNAQVDHPLNRVITKTLGRVGFITAEYYRAHDQDPTTYVMPASEEYWYAEIVSEIGRNLQRGCYLLLPIRKVANVVRDGRLQPDIVRLIPGTFEVKKDGRTLYIYPPRTAGSTIPNYVLDGDTKDYILRQHKVGAQTYSISSFVVVFDHPGFTASLQAAPPTTSTRPEPLLDLDDLSSLISD